MRKIEKIKAENAAKASEILFNAYVEFRDTKEVPKEEIEEAKKKLETNYEASRLYGCFDDDILKGVMYIVTRQMTLFGSKIKVGTNGALAVDLLHKKEKVAYSFIKESLSISAADGCLVQALYPFNASFYRSMGFGYGGRVQKFRIEPSSFPRGERGDIRFLGKEDIPAMKECYESFSIKYNGMIDYDDGDYANMVKYGNSTLGAFKDGKMQGYMYMTYETADKQNKYIQVRDLVYLNPETLLTFSTFLNSQADQYKRIGINSHDQYLHYYVTDARRDIKDIYLPDNNEVYTYFPGVMYRILDLPGIIQSVPHNYGRQTLTLKINIEDNVLGDKSYIVSFEEGRAKMADTEEFDVEISMNIANFSSMFMGAVDFKSLLGYGLAKISDNSYVEAVEMAFKTDRSPMCTKFF